MRPPSWWDQHYAGRTPKSAECELLLVELRGVEPRTSSMRTKRATNCATAPSASPRLADQRWPSSVVDGPATLENLVQLADALDDLGHLGDLVLRHRRRNGRGGRARGGRPYG